MRPIDTIVIHCSATKEGVDLDVNDIRRMHLQRGFNDVGYHFVITLDGKVQKGRPLSVIGAHCFTEGHEVLTIDGWKKIEEVTMNDLVADVSDDLICEFKKPLKLIKGSYNHFYNVKTSAVDFECTSEHEFLHRGLTGGYKKSKISEFAYKNNQIIPTSCNYEGYLDIDKNLLKLYIAIICDGSLIKDYKNDYKGFRFSLKKERKISKLKELLSLNGFNKYELKLRDDGATTFRVYSREFCNEFNKLFKDKQLTFQCLNLKEELRNMIVEEYHFWDGNYASKGKGLTMSTVSKINADVIQAISCLSGKFSANYNEAVRSTSFTKEMTLRTIGIRNRDYTQISPNSYSEVNDDYKDVFCIETTNGNIIVRRNNKSFIAGNCKGHNTGSIGICYIGGLSKLGVPKDTRTQEQLIALADLIRDLIQEVGTIKKIVGHRDLSPDLNGDGEIDEWEWVKVCPCFDVDEFIEYLGIKEML